MIEQFKNDVQAAILRMLEVFGFVERAPVRIARRVDSRPVSRQIRARR